MKSGFQRSSVISLGSSVASGGLSSMTSPVKFQRGAKHRSVGTLAASGAWVEGGIATEVCDEKPLFRL